MECKYIAYPVSNFIWEKIVNAQFWNSFKNHWMVASTLIKSQLGFDTVRYKYILTLINVLGFVSRFGLGYWKQKVYNLG